MVSGSTRENNFIGDHIDGSTLDVNEMPTFSQQMPFINAKDQKDYVHENRMIR